MVESKTLSPVHVIRNACVHTLRERKHTSSYVKNEVAMLGATLTNRERTELACSVVEKSNRTYVDLATGHGKGLQRLQCVRYLTARG